MRAFILLLAATAVYGQWDTNMESDRYALVHLFEWKWTDIANECETFLGPNGYGGVQVSPPNEHAVLPNDGYPWWQRYQPVSYKLDSRSGTELEFADMISRCKSAGVVIYVDAVINHMAAAQSPYDKGCSGSYYDTATLSYPEVPYSDWDFNSDPSNAYCPTGTGGSIGDYNNADEVRNCRLLGLPDLALGKNYVRGKVIDFMNNLINMGVAGFRVDAVKHMWPGDLGYIFGALNNLNSGLHGVGKRPFIFQEVIDMGGEGIKASDYTDLGRVTEFLYGDKLGECVLKRNGQQMKNLQNFGESWQLMSRFNALAFVDNHDNQRGHGGGGNIVTHEHSTEYKIANAFMLAWDYGVIRVMSSYYFTDGDQGPPSDGAGATETVNCGGKWVCEHRWRQIKNMVKFHNVAVGTGIGKWWDNGYQAIAFSRGDDSKGYVGFVAINNEDFAITGRSFDTGLPAGTYCDVISGDLSGKTCTGREIYVDSGGWASIDIYTSDPNNDVDPIVAIHIGAKKN